MRVGKKHNVGEIKKTRSCVVRLEKVSKSSPNVSPSPEENRYTSRTNRLNTTAMGATPKGRRGGISSQQDDKSSSKSARKKFSDSSPTTHTTFQQQKMANIPISSIKPNQKVKIVSKSNKAIAVTTPPRDESPPPTIAAGRSRRAIKPNPKYASEDIVTSKVVRNVSMLSSSTGRRGSSGNSRVHKDSSSSDDFYNRKSEDEYGNDSNNMDDDDDANFDNDEDFHNDKASDKDEHDSDYSVVEEIPARSSKLRTQPKKSQEFSEILTPQNYKLPTQPTIVKRTSAATPVSSSNLRSAPSQLQQIRRSLASANAQRNLNLLVTSGGVPQKRKLEEIQDISDNESSYSVKRKQILLSNPSGLKVNVPVRENRVNATSTPITKTRFIPQTQTKVQQLQTVNGCKKINNTQISPRRVIEIDPKCSTEAGRPVKQSTASANINKIPSQNTITTQPKMLASKTHRFRTGSPKLAIQKEKHNNGPAITISSLSSSSSSLNVSNKAGDKGKLLGSRSVIKSKSATSSHKSAAVSSDNVHKMKDDSPNSTIDDFETMPTFTIVNVNDIINKKGDVLITKSKSNNNKPPTVIEFSESITLDDDDDDDNHANDDVEEVEEILSTPAPAKCKKLAKVSKSKNSKELVVKKFSMIRSNEQSNRAPQILNHKLGIKNARVSAKTTTKLTANLNSPDKPAPRILNSVVAKKTQPVKPMIANMDDSADESFPLSLDEDEDEDVEPDNDVSSRVNLAHIPDKDGRREYQNIVEVDNEDTESQNTEEDDVGLNTTNSAATNIIASKALALAPKQAVPQRRRRVPVASNIPFTVSSNKKRMPPAAAKENSLAATNQQFHDAVKPSKQTDTPTIPPRRNNTEKTVISKQGDKIIKKITCFETWYVINMPIETKRPTVMKNQLEMPLIRLANNAKHICLPNDLWSCKVTLYELSPQTLAKSTYATYTGDLYEHNISEEDRSKYQPSCVMFRRSVEEKHVSRMPYDRAVIFKNKTFYTNIEGKNIRLVGAPSIINNETEIEILLEVMDSLTLQSDFVEHISIVQ